MDTRPEVIAEATALLDDVARALVRLSDGTYRSCEVCATPLTDEALATDPTRRRCDEHHATLAE